MPNRTYPLSGDAPPIEISWMGRWEKFTVMQGKRVLSVVDEVQELEAGLSLTLVDDSPLKIQLQRGLLQNKLMVSSGEAVLMDPVEHQRRRSRSASTMLILIGVAGVLFALSTGGRGALELQLSMGSLWIGTLGVLGRMGSPAALIIAAVMATVGGLGMLYEVDEGMLLPLVAFLIIAGILGVLIRGIDASIAVIMSR